MICPKCQAKQKVGACFCHQCGWGLKTNSGGSPRESQVKAKRKGFSFRSNFIQAFFLGLMILSIFGISIFLIAILFVK